MPSSNNKKKLLVPLAALLAAGAVVSIAVFQSGHSGEPASSKQPTPTMATTPPPTTPAVPLAPTQQPQAPTRKTTKRKEFPVGTDIVKITAIEAKPTSAADLANTPWKKREEWRKMSVSLFDIGSAVRKGNPLPAEIEFPLFDGKSVTLNNLRFRPQRLTSDGVFLAGIKGEDLGSHALLSYANNALTGEIHGPSGSYTIRNNTPKDGTASQIFLEQLDPSKMPPCGTCLQLANKTASAVAAKTTTK
jgi:hypothetical protein